METKTLHFRVGAAMGIRLMEIALEHFIYGNDFDKALRTLALGEGCDEQMQIELLIGKKIILVDEETQEFVVVERENYMHLDKEYPKLDVEEYLERLQRDINDRGSDIKDGLNEMVRKFSQMDYYSMDFSLEATLKYIYGDNQDMIDELEYDFDLNSWAFFMKSVKDFIETSWKKIEEAKKLATYFPDVEVDLNTYRLMEITQAVQQIARGEFYSPVQQAIGLMDKEDDIVQSYIDNAIEIDKTIEAGIEPVDIMDNYSAGWLSPEGVYYALNGEIANMLHNQIASALYEQGIIPESEDNEMNPDGWLEVNGWTKIHGDWILFGGYDKAMHHLSQPEEMRIGECPKLVPMTKDQQRIIADYGRKCHNGTLKLGFAKKEMSASQFRQVEEIMLKQHFCFMF